MKSGIIYFLVILLISSAHVDARNVFKIENYEDFSVMEQLPPEFVCESCLVVSRKVEEILADPKFLETVHQISTKVCQMLPSDRLKCQEMAETYVHQAILSLQHYFGEQSLCNSTGLCIGESKSTLAINIEQHGHIHSWFLKQIYMLRLNDKISDEKSCAVCHQAIDEILKDLEDPDMEVKVLQILLKACDNAKNHVKECKRLVFEYVPLALANIEKFVNKNDLCSILRFCRGAAHHTEEEGRKADTPNIIQLPHARHFRSAAAAGWMLM